MTTPRVRLDTVSWIPSGLRGRLERHKADFEAAEYLEDIKDQAWFSALAADLQAWCVARGVIAYHCTREAEPGEIASRGLKKRSRTPGRIPRTFRGQILRRPTTTHQEHVRHGRRAI